MQPSVTISNFLNKKLKKLYLNLNIKINQIKYYKIFNNIIKYQIKLKSKSSQIKLKLNQIN